ncbi:hypothetical protein, partial [Pseudomonas lactis]|uniref:hypothetical protein n=1 Tax=Pseudomonas lactis TaxID=1615674 RepID=UPI001F23F882
LQAGAPDVRQDERKQTFKSSKFLVLTADANVTVSLPKIASPLIRKHRKREQLHVLLRTCR